MPNWCSNILEVSGPANLVQHFLTGFLSKGFAAAVPEPAGAKDDDEFDMQEWCVQHWGTKWNVSPDDLRIWRDEVRDGTRTVMITFDTAWSPPTAWLTAVAAQYLGRPIWFRLAYLEDAMGFSGAVTYSCHPIAEQITSGRFPSDNPFEVVRYRTSLLQFDVDAALSYEFLADITGARLPITPQTKAQYPSLTLVREALAAGDQRPALELIGREMRCTFDAQGPESLVELLSDDADDAEDYDQPLQTEVSSATLEGDDLVIAAEGHFVLVFRVPFVSTADFCATCAGSDALRKGVRLWFGDLELAEYDVVAVRPAPRNWPTSSLASLGDLLGHGESAET